MDALIKLLRENYKIKWVGYHSPMNVKIHLINGTVIKKLQIELKKDYTEESFRQILSSSATKPGSKTGTIWSSDSRLELLRLASILGINIGGSCNPGCGQEFDGELGCIMAYDIESDRSRIPLSSFGSLSESITSIAAYCSCNQTKVFSFIRNVDFDYVVCKNSKDMVTQFLNFVKLHAPQWLIGYNNFGYDNTRIAYHSDDCFDDIMIPMRIGSGSSLTYAYYIDVEGVYNADLLTYLDKTRRSSYNNMKLATLVEHHNIEHKMEFDTADLSDIKRLFEYNLHDCKITMELAIATGALTEISSLCTVACVPVIDAVRFVTGTFAACSIASYCLKNKISMDWSPCSVYQEYRGAEVLKPVVGLHENVVSCDFSSMYPTVMLGSNISIENYSISKSTKLEGSTWTSSTASNFVINGKRVSFHNRDDTIIPPVMRLFVNKRKLYKKKKDFKSQAMSLGLKITANSIYGSLGDSNSRIYSPMCSAAITTGGRWCLAVAETIIGMYGFQVVYGDTDSCYVKPTDKVKCTIEEVVNILSIIFSHTPFDGMSMEIEDRFVKIAFMGKKTYFGKNIDGTIVSKGMSKSRKDRLGICRTLASNVVDMILSQYDTKTTIVVIADMISYVMDMAVTKQLRLSEISKYVKKGGSNYFEYKFTKESRETLECETYTGDENVDYFVEDVVRLIAREMRYLLNVSNLGSLPYIMRHASII